ncbi:sulfur oxidation c-type cytochrome SoxA [Geminicoccus harenae]|uniref:sulfur oxidation c-type cytochrome SoxA n=1 Tax=Geminicoccus harenae TaxID=2498453 RepID=UPI00168B19EB|nr:sulfur oxidation c-type cytochrome SoxA [Geminicoccus harenae]
MRGRPWALLLLAAVLAAAAAAADIPEADRRSGYELMSPELRAMQDDELSNPGMFSVLDGERLWQEPGGAAGTACAGCHGDAEESMRGVAARYPAFDAALGRPIDLAGRISQCRTERQEAEPLPRESEALLALSAFVAHQSRGLPIDPPDDPRLQPFRARGAELYQTPIGQLDLACASCHDDNWGRRLGGSTIPQAHPTGYPLYRLEWQALGSLQRRLRNCMIGVRATPFDFGAPELIELELHLMARAAGMAMETPAIRP